MGPEFPSIQIDSGKIHKPRGSRSGLECVINLKRDIKNMILPQERDREGKKMREEHKEGREKGIQS